MMNGAGVKVRPWFQHELERVTGERWSVLTMPTTTRIECPHGGLFFVAHPHGLNRPFLNDTNERGFVRKALMVHARDYGLGYREGQRG